MNPFDDTPHTDDFFVSSEPHWLDYTWIVNTILGTYWGNWRTHDIIVESIRNSLCFSLCRKTDPLIGGEPYQVGFARVITDYATFSEIADVVIEPAYRKRGLGRFLVGTVIRDPRIAKTVQHLGTRDAWDFYAKLGFHLTQRMKRIPENK